MFCLPLQKFSRMQEIPAPGKALKSGHYPEIYSFSGDSIPVQGVPPDSLPTPVPADSTLAPQAANDTLQSLETTIPLPVTVKKPVTVSTLPAVPQVPAGKSGPDTLQNPLAADSLILTEIRQPEALVLGKGEKTLYPRTFNLERNDFPDSYLILVLLSIGFLAWSRIFYEKFLMNIFRSGMSYTAATKLYEESGLVQKRILRLFFALYLLSAGLYLFVLSDYFGWSWPPENPYLKTAFFISIPSGIALVRYLVMSLTGYLFGRQKVFSGYLFHHFINNRMLGILLLPFLLLIPYTEYLLRDVAVYMSLGTAGLIYILKIYRALRYIMKNVIFIFYLILYLCALELMPLLVAIKLILSLA
jgi:hypothetical protein